MLSQESVDETKPILAVLVDVGAPPTEVGEGAAKVSRPVFVIGPSDTAAASREILKGFGEVIDLPNDLAEVAAELRRLGAAGVTTFSERMLEATSRLAVELSLPHQEISAVKLLTDKYAQRQRLREAGVSGVRSVLIYGPADWQRVESSFPLPAVIKPVRGEGSRNTYLLTDRVSAAHTVRALTDPFTEPFVVEEHLAGCANGRLGDYVSVECAIVDGDVHPIAVTGKLPLLPPFRESGQFWPARLSKSEQERVLQVTIRALTALEVRTGIVHLELKLTRNGPEVIEVNGRIGGTQSDLAMRSMGLDMIELGCRIALGQRPRPRYYAGTEVHFQAFCLAPRMECTLLSVTGIPQATSQDGIIGYRRLRGRGSRFDGGVSTDLLGMVVGESVDHPAMLDSIDQALRELCFTFQTTQGVIRLRGDELARG